VVIVAGTLRADLVLRVMYQQWTRGLRHPSRAADLGGPATASGARP
jgi:hypothetical protein